MKTVITVEARMRSTRLPGKVLRPILSQPMLALMIERLRRVRLADEIVVATTVHEADEPIVALAEALGVGCYRGSEDDVLSRVLGAATEAGAELVVETTADCPLIDPGVIDQVIQTFITNDVDYCANVLSPTYPRGMDVQVFPTAVLADVAAQTNDPDDREHVSLYIYQHPDQYRLLNVASGLDPAVASLRLTVDTPEDYELVSRIYQELYPIERRFTLHDILALLARYPEMHTINNHVRQKAVRERIA
ncbi:MAG: cytidylyltransferase domain-containing protein [Gemmatimonadales bacterium]